MKKKFETTLYNLRNNIILILLIVGGILNDFALRALTVGSAFYWKPIIASIAMILLVSILASLVPYKKKNTVYVILSTVFGMISAFNYLYYKHYSSFLSFSLMKQFRLLKEMENVISNTLDFGILIFAIPTIIMIIAIKKLKKINYFEKIPNANKKGAVVRPLLLGASLLAFVFTTLTSTDLSRLAKQWNRPYIVEQLGIYSFTTADLFKNVRTQKLPKFEEAEVESILDDLVAENTNSQNKNPYTDIFKGKDIYVIHYESAQTFAMDLEFEDGPVTPFLNKMASQGLFFDNFYPQHSVGTSSDSEFTFSTSLLPINNGTVFMTHDDRDYETIQKLLKKDGYYTMSMHGNNGDFWNRNMMYQALGYDKFINKDDYIIDEEIGLGLSDISFFDQSIEKIKEIKEEEDRPIMAKLITLTNHYPFDDVDKYGEFTAGHLEDYDIGNYLKSYHYADMALESFVQGMDEEGLLDDAIIVLYGDHHAKIANSDYEKVYNYDESTDSYYTEEDPEYVSIDGAFHQQLRRTPFIIWSKDSQIAERISTPMGMSDVLPTLGNMMGFFNQYQLGIDMMNPESVNNKVIFPDGSWVDDTYYYSSSNTKLYSIEGNVVVEEDDEENSTLSAENERIEETIEMSSNIINGDLIRKYNIMLAHNKSKKSKDGSTPEIDNDTKPM